MQSSPLPIFRILGIACALALGACETAPVNVENAKAVVVQNEVTKSHIKTFTDANKKTQAHVKKVQEEAIEEETSLQSAKKYLEELLNP